MSKIHIISGILFCSTFWVLFLIFPRLDIAIAEYFYDFSNNEFIGNKIKILDFVHYFTILFPIFLSIGSVLFLLGSLYTKVLLQIKQRKKFFFVLLCLWIGPGFVVNYIFKDHWGRPRPTMVQHFNGDKIFQKPFIISNQCSKNCSFVCGDASIGFWMFSFIPLAHKLKNKILFFSVAILTGGALGLMRISQGEHFFSDVIFCGIFVYISTWGVYWLIYEINENYNKT